MTIKEISKEKVKQIKEHHVKKSDLINDMRKSSSDEESLKLHIEWQENEFVLQDLCGFGRDARMHRFWDQPKCKCPKMDNQDAIGSSVSYINRECYHGLELKE